jgi:hypothetical protein
VSLKCRSEECQGKSCGPAESRAIWPRRDLQGDELPRGQATEVRSSSLRSDLKARFLPSSSRRNRSSIAQLLLGCSGFGGSTVAGAVRMGVPVMGMFVGHHVLMRMAVDEIAVPVRVAVDEVHGEKQSRVR